MAEKSLEVKKDFESLVFSEEGRDFIGSIDTIKDVINFRFLEKIKVPSGAVPMWTLKNAEREEEVVKSFKGIIVGVQRTRAYWEKDLSEGGNNKAPDCSSVDGVVGNIYGSCAKCAKSHFGENKEAPACAEKLLLYVLLEGSMILPCVVQVPSTSIKEYQNYLMDVLKFGKALNMVTTEFSLVKVENKDKIAYCKIQFKKVGNLNKEQIALVKEYTNQVVDIIKLKAYNETIEPENEMPESLKKAIAEAKETIKEA